MASLTAFPSFQPEWGVRIIRTESGPRLRTVEFHVSVWYSGYREIRPGTFARNPSAANYQRTVREVPVSTDVAQALQGILRSEVGRADKKNERFGFDGQIYMFSSGGVCATAWSPESNSRSRKLVEVFETLKTQASVPTRWLQLFWERRAFRQLQLLAEETTMTTGEYLLVLGLGSGIVLLAALPIFIALVLAAIPRSLPRKRAFVFVSGAMSYGSTCLVALLFLPFLLASTQLAVQLDTDGHTGVAMVVGWIGKVSPVAVFGFWLVASVATPIFLRRRWRTLANATQQAIAGSPNASA